MTFQVAFVGAAGMVLASDKREITEGGYRTENLISKLELSRSNKAAWMFSGSNTARLAAYKLSEKLSREECALNSVNDLEQAMLECAKDAYSEKPSLRDFTELLVGGLADSNSWQILTIDIAKTCVPNRKPGKYICGDTKNPAQFLVEHHFKNTLSMPELLLLAAHVVLVAHEHNQTYVEGLDIAYWKRDSEGFVEVTDESKRSMLPAFRVSPQRRETKPGRWSKSGRKRSFGSCSETYS